MYSYMDMNFNSIEDVPNFGSISMFFKGIKQMGYIEQGNKKLRKYILNSKDLDKLNLITNALNGSRAIIADLNQVYVLSDNGWIKQKRPSIIDIQPLSVTENNTYIAGSGKAYNPIYVNVPQTTIEEISITQNGTYTAQQGKAYTPINVNVPQTTIQSLSITQNGIYTAPSGKAYTPVSVDVQPDLTTKNITQNGTYNASSDNVDGYSSVNVNVPQTTIETLNVTSNGEYTAPSGKAYTPVNVNVPTPKIAGIEADFDALTVTRIADSASWQAGEDYDVINAFGLRRRCNVADDGTINAWCGDETYTEDGSNGQVMVYQPRFYYKVEPVETGTETLPNGATKTFIKKGRWYVSDVQHDGFKLHPLFKDKNGAEIDFVLKSAFEGALYDASENAYAPDLTETITLAEGDRLDSVSGQKPISGRSANLTKPNAETLANGHGADWHISTIQDVSAEQLLMIVELASFDTQTALENGVVSYASGTGNESAQTGSTKGNRSGHAASTLRIQSNGTQNTGTTGGYRSIYYRGVENFFGNIWKHVNGLNIWGDGNMHGGQAYICSDFNFDESKHDDNYVATGLYAPNSSGYVKYFGYNSDFDWLFATASITSSTSTSLIKDYTYIMSNLNTYKIARLGGYWARGLDAGGFYWSWSNGAGFRSLALGARLLYSLTKNSTRGLKKGGVMQVFNEEKIKDEKEDEIR